MARVKKLPLGWWVWRSGRPLTTGGWCPTKAVRDHAIRRLSRPCSA